MSRLVHPFPVPLGGGGLSSGNPWITNLIPAANAQAVSLLSPVRLSFRDAESYVDPALMLVEVGYAKAYAFATALDSFDKIAKTRKVSLTPGRPRGDAEYSLAPSGIKITKTSSDSQKGCYATSVLSGSGHSSAMVSGVVLPGVLSTSVSLTTGPLNQSVYPGPLNPLPYSTLKTAFASGTVLGIEHGPRNKVVYLFLCMIGGQRNLQLTSYRPLSGNPIVNLTVPYDWSAGFQRYTIVWNEAYGYVEVYADAGGVTTRVFRVPIASVPDTPSDYFARYSTPGEVVAIYGQEGIEGDSSVWSSIAVTTDVGYPILGTIRPGNFKTSVIGTEILRTFGDRDPRDLDIGCWVDAPEYLEDRDPAAAAFASGGVFKMIKQTLNKTFVIYREEPGLLRSNIDGFMIEARMVARPATQDSASTGMGLSVFDGRNYFQLLLYDDFAHKTVGVMRRFGEDADASSYYFPTTPIDWSKDGFRFIVDPRYKRIKFYALSDLSKAVLDVPFERTDFPTDQDRQLGGKPPFVAFGHITPTRSKGTLEISELSICHLYQEWESRLGVSPEYNRRLHPTDTISGSVISSSLTNEDGRSVLSVVVDGNILIPDVSFAGKKCVVHSVTDGQPVSYSRAIMSTSYDETLDRTTVNLFWVVRENGTTPPAPVAGTKFSIEMISSYPYEVRKAVFSGSGQSCAVSMDDFANLPGNFLKVRIVRHFNTTGVVSFSSVPSGWVLVAETNDGNKHAVSHYYKILTQEDADEGFVWTWSKFATVSIEARLFDNIDETDPLGDYTPSYVSISPDIGGSELVTYVVAGIIPADRSLVITDLVFDYITTPVGYHYEVGYGPEMEPQQLEEAPIVVAQHYHPRLVNDSTLVKTPYTGVAQGLLISLKPKDPIPVDAVAMVSPLFFIEDEGNVTHQISNGVYRISTGHSSRVKVHRPAPFDAGRGGIMEVAARVTSYKSRSRTGVYFMLDDGDSAYALTFVDTNAGKFVVLSVRDALGGFREITGRDGEASKYSFACDWTQFHIYRLERKPYGGVHVFFDGEDTARIVYQESKISQLPDEQFEGIPSIAFGHFTGESSVSEWKFIRGFFSGGYEVSFKKNKDDKALYRDLFGTQAIVVAYAEDRDF